MSRVTDAIIVAAGRGLRARRDDSSTPKQYVALGKGAVLSHTIQRFLDCPAVRRVVVVIHPDDAGEFEALGFSTAEKLVAPVFGGATRQQSVLNGLTALSGEAPDYVMIHDGVRPLFSQALLEQLLVALRDDQGVLPVLPVTDTVKRVSDGVVAVTVDRSALTLAQTPQCFPYQPILAAHKAAALAVAKGEATFTDDASIAEWHGLKVGVIAGEADNIKITTAGDFDRGEMILQQQGVTVMGDNRRLADIRLGNGYDVHAFEEGDAVILCGVEIPFDKKLKGHSDADVGMHAITDALYGAIGAGDIGRFFPPSEAAWKDASSDRFLVHAVEMVAAEGGVINNIDLTLICEAPKIGPHAAAMIETIARIAGVEPGRVSIKATTSERLGFTGRGEGIAAMATVSVCMGRP